MKALLAEFTSVELITEAARRARAEGHPVLDALTPYPIPGLLGIMGASKPRVRVPMAVAGLGVALFAFGFQWWTTAVAYPFNSGGRPLFSWAVFLLVPFEVGVLAAAVAGFAAFLFGCGLPRLNHPVFDVPNVERASQDRFFLLLDPLDPDAAQRLRRLLLRLDALAVSETET